MTIYDWERDQARILARLAGKSLMKICCKVRDEPLLTEAWIEHHANIVGYENIIIADNMSSDPDMIRILEAFADKVTIFRFAGPHNAINWHPRFRPMFQAVRDTCRFFTFIDIDERLVHIANDRYRADRGMLDILQSLRGDEIIACAWLINALGSYTKFCGAVDGKPDYLRNNLRWGKPILPSSLAGVQAGIHNAQFDDFAFSTEAGTGFCLLHLTEFPERRIATNRNKLVSRGIVDDSTSAEQILDLDFSGRDDKSFMPLVDEMRRMKSLIGDSTVAAAEIYAGHHYAELQPDGAISFADETAREQFRSFVTGGAQLVQATFNASLPQGPALGEDLYGKAISSRDSGNETRAEALLHYGMQAFPRLKHTYDGPAFQKELLRMYLSAGEWERAQRLIPTEPGDFSAHWHCILFARATAAAGQHEAAQYWWSEVLRFEPGNGEAQNAGATVKAQGVQAARPDGEPIVDDLQDVRNLANQGRVQPHWFMMKYFQYAGKTTDEAYRRLSMMADEAENLARARGKQSEEPVLGPRIPRLMHKVWLTNPETPSEPLDRYITDLLSDAETFAAAGWKTILWVQDEGLIPGSVGRIRASEGPIEIRRVRDHFPDGEWQTLFNRFLADRKFPFAADILRMAILDRYGGFYGDLGVRIRDVDIANFVADGFDYSFILWETLFFQNSFMAMAPRCELSRTFMTLANDPYLVPAALMSPLTALTEGQAFSGLMVTAIMLSIWRPQIKVFPFAANRQLLSWSSQQSWYKKDGKYGNTYVPDSQPSFYSEDGLRQHERDPKGALGNWA